MKVSITQLNVPPPAQGEVQSGIVAVVGGQDLATKLTGKVNIVSTVPLNGGVAVQVVSGRQRQEVINRGTRDLLVYPPKDDRIGTEGADNQPISLPVNGGAIFTRDTDGTWLIVSVKSQTLEITEDTELSAALHDGRTLIVSTPGVTLTAAYADLGSGFFCLVHNVSGGDVVMGGWPNVDDAVTMENRASGAITAIAWGAQTRVLWWANKTS